MPVILNLADWIERRKADVGPYADNIIHSVRAHEAEIERLREHLVAICEKEEWASVDPYDREGPGEEIQEAREFLAPKEGE